MDTSRQPERRQRAGHSAALRWFIFGAWVLGSMAGLGIFEYQAALRGILCIVPR